METITKPSCTRRLLPDIQELSEFVIFSRTSPPHIELVKPLSCFRESLQTSFPQLRDPPTARTDLNPVDYRIRGIVQEKVYRTKVRDVDDLRERIVKAWEELGQRIIDCAVGE